MILALKFFYTSSYSLILLLRYPTVLPPPVSPHLHLCRRQPSFGWTKINCLQRWSKSTTNEESPDSEKKALATWACLKQNNHNEINSYTTNDQRIYHQKNNCTLSWIKSFDHPIVIMFNSIILNQQNHYQVY